MILRVTRTIMFAGAAAAVVAGCTTVTPAARLTSFSLGRNTTGEACVASRDWHDPAVPDAFARSYAITCQNVAASRPLGALRVVDRTPAALAAIEAGVDCAAPVPAKLAGEPAKARRCFNRTLGTETVRIDLDRRDSLITGEATPGLVAQLEEGLAIVAGIRASNPDLTRTVTATVDPALLPARPGAEATSLAAGDTPLDAAGLNQGISLNHKGLYVDASRVLNDAISRLPTGAPPAVRAELLLEAGLADSNIRFSEAARTHFADAERVFAESPGTLTPFLAYKRDTYLALDALNRHDFDNAIAILDRIVSAPAAADQPLRDPATLRLLNQSRAPRADAASALAVPNAGDLARLALDAEAHYARSVALLSRGNEAGSSAALDLATKSFRPLANERIDQSQLLWLGARIDRQRGRLLARSGRYGEALTFFDRAIDALRRGALANAGTGNEPAIAEANLERAAVFARSGAPRGEVRATFAQAVNALIDGGATSLGASIGMEDYLDLLVAEAGKSPQPDTYDSFFRAVQASGEPAVARQLTQLQTVVTADPALGKVVRERADLEREITRLRYALAGRVSGDTTPRADLEQARGAAEQRLIVIDAQLAGDARYRTVEERPASLAEVRAALAPGEGFLKLAALNRRIYGIYVTADQAFIYHVAGSDAAKQAVDALATRVRTSIDGDLAVGKLVPFDDAAAYALYRLVTGPASEMVAKARAIVVDPAGPLERLPIGALVTSYDRSVVRDNQFDFSQTAFLARNTTVSNALSPRSFLVARALPASRAPKAFLGLGEHTPPPVETVPAVAREIDVGFGCSVDYGRLANLSRALKPVSRRELGIAAAALDDQGAPMMIDAAFSDTGIKARDDLAQFEVLHFATHGLEEGVWGCTKSPPALVTSFGDATSDGLLSFSEIAGLRLDANLVVLSACDTASGVRDEGLARQSGQEESGATLEGLVRAFLTANARAVLATYWQVSAEQESDEFVRAFYANARTGTMGNALQVAQRTLIDQPTYSHPFYWAAYFLVGDSNKPMLSPAPARVAQR
jgi:CHAT domain-containing protein/tetratricopeptide (TPR) repeat protein